MTKRPPSKRAGKVSSPAKPVALLPDVRALILQAPEGVARAVDSGLTTFYWHVGRRVRQDILKEKRAEYGGQIVSALGRQLETEFGRGFGEKNLRRMVQFVEQFPDVKNVAALLRQLGWTHLDSGDIILISPALNRLPIDRLATIASKNPTISPIPTCSRKKLSKTWKPLSNNSAKSPGTWERRERKKLHNEPSRTR